MLKVIVIIFDNTDPRVYGPYPTAKEAESARRVLESSGFLRDMGEHVTSVSVEDLRSI